MQMMLCIVETEQITVSQIEILTLMQNINVVALNGRFDVRFCQQFRQTRVEILEVALIATK